jgi:hypothetical protein
MQLFVDYTNWHGKREWREIAQFEQGQPLKIEPGTYHHEDGSSEWTLVMHVRMVDRGLARRTLKVANIHGFRVEP